MLSEELMAERKRVSVSLSEQEYANLELISDYLGMKATKLLYMAYMEGLPHLYQRNAGLINQVTAKKENDRPKSKKKR